MSVYPHFMTVCLYAYKKKMSALFVCVYTIFLSRYGHFSGINRKVQLTYLRNGQPKASSEEEGTNTERISVYMYGRSFLAECE